MIVVYKSGDIIRLNDFRVYDMKDLAHTATITKTGVTTWNSANISLGDLVGLTDG